MPVRFSLYFNKRKRLISFWSSHLRVILSNPHPPPETQDQAEDRFSNCQISGDAWETNRATSVESSLDEWVLQNNRSALMGFRHLLRIRARKLRLLIKKSYRWTVLLLDQIILWKANLQTSLEQPVSATVITLPQSNNCFLLGKGSRNAIMLAQSWASGCRDRSVPTSQIRSNTQTHTSKQWNAVHLFDPISAIKGGYHHGMESDMLQSFCSRNTVRFQCRGPLAKNG